MRFTLRGNSEGLEDYLEAVLILQERRVHVRCVDVAELLGVSKPLVTRAVKELSKRGCLVKGEGAALSLTEEGRALGISVYEKHQFFTKQLLDAGVPLELAVKEACPMEHVISEESFLKLKSCLER